MPEKKGFETWGFGVTLALVAQLNPIGLLIKAIVVGEVLAVIMLLTLPPVLAQWDRHLGWGWWFLLGPVAVVLVIKLITWFSLRRR